MNQISKIWTSRFSSISCSLFAVANRIIFTTLYSVIGRDTIVQISNAENLIAGNGLGVKKYFTNDLNNPVFDTHQLFPPGFSISIIPFLKIFDHDHYKAVLAFDLVIAVLFIFSVRFLARKAGLTTAALNIVTIIAGCSQYPFFMMGSPTDAIGVSLLLFAFGNTIAIAQKKEPLSFLQVAWFGFVFFLPSFYRFMYIPLTILLPASIFFSGMVTKNKIVQNTGLKTVAFSTLFLFIQLCSIWLFTANAAYDVERGLFLPQVTRWYPFLPASFVNLDFVAQLGSNVAGTSYQNMMLLFEIANAFLFLLLLLLLYHYAVIKKHPLLSSRQATFVYSGSLISATLLTMLAYLTLTYEAFKQAGEYTWTYIYENRYFAFFYCFIPVLFFSPRSYDPFSKIKAIRILWIIGLLFFITEVAHGVYYNIKITLKHRDLDSIRKRDEDYRSLPAVISYVKQAYPGKELIVSSPDQFYLNKATLMGYKAVYDYTNLDKTNLKVSAKTVLLVPVFCQDDWLMKGYVERKKPKVIREIAGTTFYVQEIDPQ